MDRLQTAYHLLKDLMQCAFHVECTLFTEFDQPDDKEIDHGLRKTMWNDYAGLSEVPEWMEGMLTQSTFLVIRSNLGFYNILITLEDYEKVAIVIGPFRAEAASAIYFNRIMQESGISPEKMSQTQALFRALPVASLSGVTDSAKRILEEYFPAFRTLEIQEKSFVNETHVPNRSNEENEYLSEYSEQYKSILTNYLNALKKGDLSASRICLKQYLEYNLFDSASSVALLRKTLTLLNDYSALALFDTNVHPRRILELQDRFAKQIGSVNDPGALSRLPYDLCHKYNLLIKNHNYKEYSKIIRDVVNYIELHLEEDCSLESLALLYHRNPSTLSAQFHRETGTTLTQFVKQTKIKEAVTLLNTTDLSISEISMEIGYEDFAYFSRVFKQVTGISPRTYKQTYSSP